VKAISAGMGSGLTKNVELSDVVDEDWSEFMSLDIKIKTSRVFVEAGFWHCREGINKRTMAMLNQEFNRFRGLFPLKLFITGPPASSKTFYSH
jgi:adenylate kinase